MSHCPRVRSLAGLRLVGGITPRSLAVAPTIQEQDEVFEQASKVVEAEFAGVVPERGARVYFGGYR